MFGTALPNNSPHSADNGPINAQKEERLQDRKRAAITLKQLRDLPLQLPVYEAACAGLSTEGTAGYSLAVTYPSRISPTSIFPEALQEELQLKELIGYPQIQRAVELNDEFEPQSLDYEVNIMTQEDLEKLI